MPFAGIWGSVMNDGEHSLEHHDVEKEASTRHMRPQRHTQEAGFCYHKQEKTMCLGRVSSGKGFKFSSIILLSKGIGRASNFSLPFFSPPMESSVRSSS